jgi:hypothetical protein
MRAAGCFKGAAAAAAAACFSWRRGGSRESGMTSSSVRAGGRGRTSSQWRKWRDVTLQHTERGATGRTNASSLHVKAEWKVKRRSMWRRGLGLRREDGRQRVNVAMRGLGSLARVRSSGRAALALGATCLREESVSAQALRYTATSWQRETCIGSGKSSVGSAFAISPDPARRAFCFRAFFEAVAACFRRECDTYQATRSTS